ncbi:Zip-domain-containing protein [Neurospora hispaniola]|uniref:Zip-domain-containing protein n=1 Tax=Neurospora hispaniola TaxID=588809 RepID=A0AAJ0MLP2_9PEZI|nr:Zip-domain-containing protein [Neurospora hispaniola]
MNCPSRNDDAELEHPFWNQQPHYLAADLTTCQDLNGIANSRTHRYGSQGSEVGVCALNHHPGGGIRLHDADRRPQVPPEKNNNSAGRRSIDPAPQKSPAAGGEDRACRTRTSVAPLLRSAALAVPGWVTWVLSVVVTSLIMSTIMTRQQHGNDRQIQVDAALHVSAVAEPVTPRVFKRASTCPKGGVSDEELYNTAFHGAALAIIFGVSFLACAFPVLMTRFPMIRLPPVFFFAVRHFGTGVLIATAFVHLLPTAFISLSNQCLDSFWTQQYPAMPGAIALAAIFMVTIVEMVFHPGRHVHHGPHEQEQVSGAPAQSNTNDESIDPLSRLPSNARAPDDTTNNLPSRPKGALRGRAHSIGRRLSHVSRQGQDPQDRDAVLPALPSEDYYLDTTTTTTTTPQFNKEIFQSDLTLSSPSTQQVESQLPHDGYMYLTAEMKRRKETMQCVLLECGILFHSVFIGMALSVSVGTDFVVLLIAIAFHQTFEGLALGSRIASITWPEGSKQPWFMALAYGCTTPIGQAIGLATHRLYSPESEVGLILVGTMNAISSGLLVFASLVELLSEDFLSDESWRTLRGKRRAAACVLVFAGAVGMSLVGAWA